MAAMQDRNESDDPRRDADELEERLARARAAVAERDRLQARLEHTRKHQAVVAARMKRLQERADREREDVETYANPTLSALFEQVFGDLEARHEKERQEWVAAHLKLEQAKAELAATQADAQALERRLAADADPRPEYHRLLELKDQLLEQGLVAHREQHLHLAERVGVLEDALRELDEAEWAGHVARAALTGLLHCLSKAQALGRLDMVGLASSLGKISHIDEAHRHASAANRALSRFQMELADVHHRHEARLEMQIGHLATFADAFLDDLVSDWVVQCRIERSHSSAGIARTRVNRTLRQIVERRLEVARELADVRERREGLDAPEG